MIGKSCGICDNCTEPKMILTGTYKDKEYFELYCHHRKIFIELKNEEDRILKCEYYKKNNYVSNKNMSKMWW